MATFQLHQLYEHIEMEYPVESSESVEPAVRITNSLTGESEEWYGPYAQALGKSLQLVSEYPSEVLEEHPTQRETSGDAPS